jgi:hypothetical protein
MFLILFSVACEFVQPDPLYYLFTVDLNIFLSLVAGFILIIFLATVVFNGLFPKLKILPMFMHLKYPVYYATFNLILALTLVSFYDKVATPYVVIGMVVVNLLVLLVWRPYPEKIHNVTIVLEQGTVLVAMGTYLLESYTDQKDNRETIFTIAFYLIIVLLLAMSVLSVIRLYMFRKYMT